MCSAICDKRKSSTWNRLQANTAVYSQSPAVHTLCTAVDLKNDGRTSARAVDDVIIYNMLYAMGRFPNIGTPECQHSHMAATRFIFTAFILKYSVYAEETDKIIRIISASMQIDDLYDETQLNSALLYWRPREAPEPTVRRIVTSILCLVAVIILNFFAQNDAGDRF